MVRCELAPGFSIFRVLTGLLQIGDMERDNHRIALKAVARTMLPYVNAGFTAFDMADHNGSLEKIVGLYRQQKGPKVQVFTKWAPEPGGQTRESVRKTMALSEQRCS